MVEEEIKNIKSSSRYSLFYFVPKGFYRKIASTDHKQYPVYSSKEIKQKLFEKEALYATICLFKNERTFPTHFFYDFDCDKIAANKEIDKLIDYCNRMFLPFSVTEPRRGFHFYVHIAPIEMDSVTFSYLSNHIIASSDIKNYDDQVDGVITGISRLPGSYYPNLNRRVRIIEQKLFPFKNPLDLLDDDVHIPNFKQTRETRTEGNSYRPCIDYFIQDIHPSQFIRFAWASLRISQKKTDKQIVDEARTYHWEDWNEFLTLYQVQQIRVKQYAIPSCGTIQKKGYCVSDICEWRKHKR